MRPTLQLTRLHAAGRNLPPPPPVDSRAGISGGREPPGTAAFSAGRTAHHGKNRGDRRGAFHGPRAGPPGLGPADRAVLSRLDRYAHDVARPLFLGAPTRTAVFPHYL